MIDIQDIINKTLEEKLKDGSIEKIVSDKIDECVSKALDEALNGWGDKSARKLITQKLEEVVNTSIESRDFSAFLPKITEVLDTVLMNSTVKDYRVLAKNLGIVLKETEQEVKMSDLFNKYVKMLEDEGITSNDTDTFDFEYGEGAQASVELRQDEDTGEYVFKFSDEILESDSKYNDYTVRMGVRKWVDGDVTISSVGQEEDTPRKMFGSLRYANSFTLYLMQLRQNFTRIIIDETEDDGDITITREY